ncbi:lipocalin family protein [Flexithrix dorotheae]|uniref:lipocalin family protein n=1 Tax=Flexithrix dorotheae TaxID=70993 RepID=UPI00036D3BEB|nr:lipocalin family protein [Flexithrix dorotheae]
MKSIKFLIFALIASVLFSCSEDEPATPDQGMIVGAWKMSSVDYSGTSTTVFNGQSTKINFTGEGKNLNNEINFSENPNEFSVSGTYDVVLKMDMGGNEMISEQNGLSFVNSGDWEIDGNKLYITDDVSAIQEATIKELSENKLVLLWTLKQESDQFGVKTIMEGDGTFTFTRN